MASSPNPTEGHRSATHEAALTVYERLERRYPSLFANLMTLDSQKHCMRACEELEAKEKCERELAEAETALTEANEGVYKALELVDKARQTRDAARQRERQTKYKYLPY